MRKEKKGRKKAKGKERKGREGKGREGIGKQFIKFKTLYSSYHAVEATSNHEIKTHITV